MSKILVIIWHTIGLNSVINNSKQMKALYFSCLCLFMSSQVFAQHTMGINFQSFLPTGELRNDSPDIWGGGISVTAAFNLKDSPIYAGGIYDFIRYGSEVRDAWHGQALGDVRYRRQNEMMRLLGFVRISPDCDAGFFPYADFMAGLNYVFTRSILRDSSIAEAFDTFTDVDDFSFTYGLGAGMEIPLGGDVLLDINFKTLKSGRTQYLTPQSTTYDTGTESYILDIQQSRFDSFSIGIGIKFYIN